MDSQSYIKNKMSPYIISASRREDIPAYPESFLEALKVGKINMKSFYQDYEISFKRLEFIVFWTKNPQPIMKYLDDIPYKYYFQFTLNDYLEYELNIPSLEERIKTFQNLSNKIGKEKVIWRFDPIIINFDLSVDDIMNRIENIGNLIHSYTEKLVFSYVDPYKKLGNKFMEVKDESKIKIAERIIELNKNWNLELSTCAESIKLNGIKKNKCIDPELIEKICGEQKWISSTKDKNQRLECGCVQSSDVGTFKTCKHSCQYCYAK